MKTVATLLALAAGLGAAAPAHGSTVTLTRTPRAASDAVAVYAAAPGESNRIVITFADGPGRSVLRFTDSGAVIAPGRRCRAVDEHTAECSLSPSPDRLNPWLVSQVSAGDMDDVVTSESVDTRANGGAGDDTLEVRGLVFATLDGGGGRDVLLGGAGQNVLTDGDVTGAADGDVLDGRGGRSTVSYDGRTASVFVDLADPGGDGERGEGDTLRSIREVVGGSGDDVLRGRAAATTLAGGPGDDRIVGRGGADSLSGGSGRDTIDGAGGADDLSGDAGKDRLDGGPGADSLDTEDDQADSLRCGAGASDGARPDRRDVLEPDCEFVIAEEREEDLFDPRMRAYPRRVTSRYAVFTVGCGAPGGLSRVDATISLRETGGARRVLGRGGPPSQRCGGRRKVTRVSVRVKLSPLGRRLVARRRGLVAAVLPSGFGIVPLGWSIRLRL